MPRYRKSLYVILCILIFIAGYISISFFYKFIINYVETKLVPDTAKEIGIDNLRFKIQSAGLFGADIAYISAGKDFANLPSIDSIHIEYDPVGLYKKYIKKIVINGVSIECGFNNEKFDIRGLDLQNIILSLQSKKSAPSESMKSFPVGSIEAKNVTVISHIENQTIRIPLEIKILSHDGNRNLISCDLRLYPRDGEIKVLSDINLDTKKIDISFDSMPYSFERFSDFIHLIPDIHISGSAAVKGNAHINLSPFKISSLSCSAALHDLNASYNGIDIKSSTNNKNGKNLALNIDIKNEGDDKWNIFASSFTIASPLPVKVFGINCKIIKNKDLLKSYGYFNIFADAYFDGKDSAYSDKNTVNIKADYLLNLSKNGNWKFKISGNTIKDHTAAGLRVDFQQFNISSKNLKFDLTGKGKGDKGNIKYIASISDLKGFNKSLSVKTPKISLSGNADFLNKSTRGSFNLNLQHINLTSGSSDADIPSVSVSGKFNKGSGSELKCDGLLKFDDVKIKDQKLKVNASGIRGTLPFIWPFGDTKSEGTVFAKTILWKNINLGSFSGSIRQNSTGLIYNAQYTSIPFKGMNLNFIGKTDLLSSNNYETKISINMQKYKLSSGIDIYRLFPQAEGMSFAGEAQLNGKIGFKEKKFTGFIKAIIEEGSFNYKDKAILIEGIKINLNLPDLPSITSAPKQQFAFDRASIGSIQLSDGRVDFQIEPTESFFIEKCRFNWCDGSVNTNALRISSLNKDLSLTLFCDRINLAKLIEQFGVAKAEGNGAVNGSIPIEYTKGKLIFTDGFLYSTPGDGGTIHLADAKLLTQNLIPGTSQFAQIELTIEALKNYKYNWAKLKFRSAGENLLLNLQFDGKPVNTLPFIYDKKTGGFVKVNSAAEGSIFQGISLDINLTIPLDKVLYYKDAMNIDKLRKGNK